MRGYNNMILKNFVVFEGIDGAGTSTQLKRLLSGKYSDRLEVSAEPTESVTGKFLRRVLSGDLKVDPRTCAYLFAADRAEHLWGSSTSDCGIEHKCSEGKVVISDRFLFSSLAYQGVTCGEELPRVLNGQFPLPEFLFFFKIDPKISLQRIQNRDVIEIYEKLDFLQATERRYEDIIREYQDKNTGMNIIIIDATKSPDEVEKQILSVLEPVFLR